MANVTLGPEGADLTNNAIRLGNYTSISPTSLTLTAFDGYTFVVTGTFSVGNGNVLGGHANTYAAYLPDGKLQYYISDINVDILTYNSFISANNVAGLKQFVFSGDDTFNGTAGNNVFIETGGRDTIHGGSGQNSLLLNYTQPSYTIKITGAGSFTLTDNVANSSIIADHVQKITFADGSVMPITITGPSTGALTITDTGTTTSATALAYSGPVATLKYQYIATHAMNITTDSTAVFLKGAGNSALVATGGNNVLDGGPGSNFLTGGTDGYSADTFFVDARSGQAVWSSVVNFHQGDAITMWGVGSNTKFTTEPNSGAQGYTGFTIHADAKGNGSYDASVTLVGIDAGHVNVAYGSVSGTSYMYLTYV